jgi:septal ring factor EnvC (AmiA/AmiB activator)
MVQRMLRGCAAATLLCAGLLAFAQSGVYTTARELVTRVQDDLQRSSGLNRRSDKEKERLDNAQKHLSQFDKGLSRGHFDKDKLDQAIDDVKNVLKNNTLAAPDRDTLAGDLRDLRVMRERRGM